MQGKARTTGTVSGKPVLTAGGLKLTTFEKIFLSVSSFVVMLFVTCSSPLYAFNFWVDSNVYLTLGRGILHGLVPYKDLYEQKGPLLFIVHALAALISQHSFLGVWFIEIGMAVVFSFFAWKTVKLCSKPDKHAVLLMPAVIAFTYTVGMMDFGDSAEELCFPLLIIIVYLVLRDSVIEPERLPSVKSAFVIGILTAALFWIKYSFLGPVIGICILMVIWTIKPRVWKRLFADIGMFLAGFILLTLPIIIYLAVNGALDDMFAGYFYNNIVFYSDKDVYDFPILYVPVIGKIATALLNLYGTCLLFPKYPVFLILCIIGSFCAGRNIRSRVLQVFYVTLAITIVTVLSRQQIMPYYAYITVYLAPFAAVLGSHIISLLVKKKLLDGQRLKVILAALSIALVFSSIITCKNIFMMHYQKSDYPQYKFAEIIRETPDANILTYDVMDGGFYLASGTLPKTQYYCYLNIEESWPVILDEQHRLIEEQAFDYIVTRDGTFEWEGYEIVCNEQIVYTNISGAKIYGDYFLYKKIS